MGQITFSLSDKDRRLRGNRITATRAAKIREGRIVETVNQCLGLSDSLPESDPLIIGHLAEHGVIVPLVQRKMGLDDHDVMQPGTIVAPWRCDTTGATWACATPDRLCVDQDGLLFNLECKAVGQWSAREWGDVDAGLLGVAPRYQGQVLWQQRITGASYSIVAALMGTEFRMYRVERDREEEQRLIDQCWHVWSRHVRDGVPCEPDASRASTQHYNHVRERLEPKDEETLRRALRRYQAAQGQDRTAKDERTLAANVVRQAMGSRTSVALDGLCRATWSKTGGLRVTWEDSK